ncbi:MAG: hypothetical protein JRI68_25090 [Deltaproteobacteria bacterium]|nr:hypothetical protein [Deltaproteobacteria bacterium]
MTNQCDQCGATISPNDTICPFCQALTPLGRHQQQAQAATETYKQQAQAQLEVRSEAQRRQQKREALESSATYSLIAGAVGLVTCCLPVGPVLAIVLGLKAQRHAVQQGLAKPPRALLGIILGIGGLVLGVVGWVYYYVDTSTRDEDVARLKKESKKGAKRAVLSKKTACQLVKIEVLQSDYAIYDDAEIDCRGKLNVTGDRAVLENVRLERTDPDKVTGCLERVDERWVVAELSKDGRCFAPAASSSASAAPAGSSAPSAAASTAASAAPSASASSKRSHTMAE